MAAEVRFMPWSAPDGQMQHLEPYVCVGEQRVEFEDGWAHVVDYEHFGGRCVLRSFPAHVISEVVHSEATS